MVTFDMYFYQMNTEWIKDTIIIIIIIIIIINGLWYNIN